MTEMRKLYINADGSAWTDCGPVATFHGVSTGTIGWRHYKLQYLLYRADALERMDRRETMDPEPEVAVYHEINKET